MKKKEEKKENELVRYRVGERDLTIIKYIKQGQKIPERIFKEERRYIESKIWEGVVSGITHAEVIETKMAIFLIHKDIFEYDEKGWKRVKNAGKLGEYDWDSLGISLNGTTYYTPDEVEKAILKSGKWSASNFDVEKQNSQDFVQFCLKSIGSNLTMKKPFVDKSTITRK
jgi:hypothetical protein